MVEGESVTLTTTNSRTDAGETPNNVYNIEWDNARAGDYTITEEDFGTLTVNKRSVTLTSADATKEYDGTPLTNDEIAVGGEGFADGEGATYNVTGSQTDVGNSANTFEYS